MGQVEIARLDDLLVALHHARALEANSKVERIAVEEQIAALVEDAPDKGSRTLRGSEMKTTVKFDFGYKCDVEKVRHLDVENLPLTLKPAEWVFDQKAFEALSESDPVAYAKVRAHVVTKVKKTSVTSPQSL